VEQDDDKTVVLGGAAAAQAAPPKPERDVGSHNALPAGTRLGEFEIEGLIGEGGFGIVYLARDHSLERRVALKEYMPASLASRGHDASVTVRSERHRETFEVGRRSFVNEARLLAQFDHAALVKVYRFWEANGTAYMVMPFYDGVTLRDALKARGAPPDEAWIRKILSPVMDALEIIHAENCFHRDIAPDNIMLLRDERPVLLDFGAARRVIGDMTQALTVILKPGYAPIEQYAEMPGMKQGPWTDIYALAAVVYFMITGRTPPPSVGRMMQDSYEPLATIAAGRYNPTFLAGIDACLGVRAESRPQTIGQMRELVGFTFAVPPQPVAPVPSPQPKPQPQAAATVIAPPVAPPPVTPKVEPQPVPAKPSGTRGLLLIIGAVVVIAGGLGAFFLFSGGKQGQEATTAKQTEQAPQPPASAVAATTPAASASASAAPQTPAQTESVPPPAPVATGPVALDDAFGQVAAGSATAFGVTVDKIRDVVVVGKDVLTFTLHTARDGYAYVLLWDKGNSTLAEIFPNDQDPANKVKAGKPLVFPRDWTYEADRPAGEWQVLAIVSDSPRDFGKLGLKGSSAIHVGQQADVEKHLGEAGASLAGEAKCDAGAACGNEYGAVVFHVSEVEKTAAATKPRASTEAPAKPAGKSQKPAGEPQQGTQAERDYMKQLNKDLDQLLGGKK
jgi:serine/threonine protein kinase